MLDLRWIGSEVVPLARLRVFVVVAIIRRCFDKQKLQNYGEKETRGLVGQSRAVGMVVVFVRDRILHCLRSR